MHGIWFSATDYHLWFHLALLLSCVTIEEGRTVICSPMTPFRTHCTPRHRDNIGELYCTVFSTYFMSLPKFPSSFENLRVHEVPSSVNDVTIFGTWRNWSFLWWVPSKRATICDKLSVSRKRKKFQRIMKRWKKLGAAVALK